MQRNHDTMGLKPFLQSNAVAFRFIQKAVPASGVVLAPQQRNYPHCLCAIPGTEFGAVVHLFSMHQPERRG
jgi:hypothetical protein